MFAELGWMLVLLGAISLRVLYPTGWQTRQGRPVQYLYGALALVTLGSLCWWATGGGKVAWTSAVISGSLWVILPWPLGFKEKYKVHFVLPSIGSAVVRQEINGRMVEQPMPVLLHLPLLNENQDPLWTAEVRQWIAGHELGQDFYSVPATEENLQLMDSLKLFSYQVGVQNKQFMIWLEHVIQKGAPQPPPAVAAFVPVPVPVGAPIELPQLQPPEKPRARSARRKTAEKKPAQVKMDGMNDEP